MKRLAVLLLLVLLAVPVARAQDDPDIEPGRYVVVGVVLYDKQTGQEIVVYNGASFATATPRPPVDTPTPEPSHTPQPPTLTPSATPSPTPSATPDPIEPTQEATILPTLPPDDAEKTCLLRTRNVRINERTEPRVSAPRTTTSPIDTYSTLKIDAVHDSRDEDGYAWGHNVFGWFVIYSNGQGWWVDTIEASVGCEDVQGWPEDLAPPAPFAQDPTGLHLIYSARREPVVAALPALGYLKGTDGTEDLLREAKRQKPELIVSYRAIYTNIGRHDCPPTWGYGDPAQAANEWFDMLMTVWGTRGLLGADSPIDFFEYRNECVWAGDWEIAFDRQMVKRASAAGVCLMAFSDAPGQPEVHEFAQRKPVLDLMLESPCDRDRLHGIALHNYYGLLSGPWLFGRWQLFREAIGPKYDALAIWFTEFGVRATDGSVIGRGQPDCAAMHSDVKDADKQFAKDAGVGGYALYSVGGGTEWMDITDCLAGLS